MEHVKRAFIPQVIPQKLTSLGLGLLLLCALAQVSIPLPFTPVPITGQTFGVTLLALLWGRNQSLIVILSYLALGAAGLPVFAHGTSGLLYGPTLGYLIGMAVSAVAVGYLADRGWARSFGQAFGAGLLGSLFTFGFGLSVLWHFTPHAKLLELGLYPFVPGDLIKCALAAQIASAAYHFKKSN